MRDLDKRKMTSIGVYQDTKERLDVYKLVDRDSYDAVINRLLDTYTKVAVKEGVI